MRRGLAVLALTAFAACGRSPAPKPSAAGLELTEYTERDGYFRCLAPAEWKVKEGSASSRDVMFFGEGGVSLAVGRYPEGDPMIKKPEDYLRSIARSYGPLAPQETTLGGRAVQRLHYVDAVRGAHARKPAYKGRTDVVLIPAPGGFYALEHRAPLETHARTLPVLDAAAASFKIAR